MKQIVDKLNKIAKKIDESVEIPQTDLIIDSLDAITKAYGGTPNDSNLIVDKLEDIYNNINSVSGNIEITENGENINVAPFATATVNVSGGGGGGDFPKLTLNITNSSESEEDISVIGTAISNMAGMILTSDMFAYYDVSFPIAIAKGETVPVTIYYSYDAYISDNTGALVMLNNDASVTTTATGNTNMTFDNDHGGWYVTDSTIDSELNITCLVGR